MHTRLINQLSRRQFLASSLATSLAASTGWTAATAPAGKPKAQVAITLDLEMSRHYPRRREYSVACA